VDGLDRRTLLLGSAGLLVAGCGGGKGGGTGGEATASATTKGPNIVKPQAGNVVTEADTAALRDRLNAAFASRDVEQLVQLVDPEDFALDDVRKRWSRRYDNFERLGFIEGEWYVGAPGGRTRNGAGGQVEYDGDLVFAHRVRGCDAQQVVESYSSTFRKKSEDAPLELLHLGDANAAFDPSIWDVATIDAIETEHAWVVFRLQDAARAKQFAARIEDGASRAFALMPRPQGVDKIFYALTWPEVDGKLYGGITIGEADANAYYHPFLDPDELARGQQQPTDRAGLPLATGRVGLHEGTFGRSDFAHVSCHEGIHVLADQWYVTGDTPTWVIEGLADWGSMGTAALMANEGATIRSSFSAFEKVVPKGYDEFHKTSMERAFYLCSAAIYAYVDAELGRDAVFEVAEAFYGSSNRDAAAEKLGRSEQELVAATRKWLGA
jgi:hypothetical protein